MGYSAEVQADSPLVYLGLGETSGTVASDASGNGRNGSYFATGRGVNYQDASPLAVGGTDARATDYFSRISTDPPMLVPAGSFQSFGAGNFSVEFLHKGTATGLAVLTGNGGTAAWWIGIAATSGFLRFNGGGADITASSGVVNDGAVHHVVVTRSGTTLTLYRDGVSVGSGTCSGAVGNAATPTGIGDFDTGGSFFCLGVYDEYALYGTALSGARVAAHYAAATGGDTTPPTLSGAATNSAGTVITATLSESGCTADGGGSSGAGGFTLSGTSATVSGWSISGTTLTLTLSGTVTNGQTVTYSYARASTTDDIKDAAGNYLADFSGASVTNNVVSASLDVTESAIDPHTAGIVLHLTGTSTNWSGGTTFTVSGVSGTSKTSQSVTNSTTATVTVATGTVAGTLTVSDGAASDTVVVSTYKTVDVTTGGVDLRVLESASYDASAATAAAEYHHGSGEDRTAWTSDSAKAGIRTQLIADGRLLLAVSAGGSNWGNDAGLACYAVAHAYLLANYNVSSVVLIGQSMGGGTGLRAIHDSVTFPRVKGYYAIYGLADVLAEYDDNAAYQSAILGAWGAADRAALVTALSDKNPIGLSAAGYAGKRYYFHHSPDDITVFKNHNTDAMRAVLATVTTFDNGIVTTTGVHGDASNFDPANASAFVTAALAQSSGGGDQLLVGGGMSGGFQRS